MNMAKPLFLILLATAVTFSIIVFLNVRKIDLLSNQKIADFAEFVRPANLNITEIGYYPCKACDSASEMAKEISKFHKVDDYYLTEWDPGAISQNSMISLKVKKYNISRIPALIVTGELEKTGLTKYQRGDAIVFEATDAPFMDVESGKMAGGVRIASVYKQDCEFCRNESVFVQELEDIGVWFTSRTFVDSASEKGREYIQKYNITKLPTAILSRELENYSFIEYTWSRVGTREKGAKEGELDVYVTRVSVPPYFDLDTGKTTGLVTVYLINDSTCPDCYDVNRFKDMFKKFYLFYKEEVYLDLPEAEALLKRYNITKVPAIVLSNEALDYKDLAASWHQVGTIEDDGNMVFRNLDGLGAKYRGVGGNKK